MRGEDVRAERHLVRVGGPEARLLEQDTYDRVVGAHRGAELLEPGLRVDAAHRLLEAARRRDEVRHKQYNVEDVDGQGVVVVLRRLHHRLDAALPDHMRVLPAHRDDLVGVHRKRLQKPRPAP